MIGRQTTFAWLVMAILVIGCQYTPEAQSAPKLVVGITIDQMRWDFLTRFKHRWHEKGGFNRMLKDGFSCNNTQIDYVPTYTACGHASIYTGTVPAIHGITGNSWWDNELQEYVYCTEDDSVKTVGSDTDFGLMSPVNLLTTTICDELKVAHNFRNKTVGIAIKDRGGILAAGHTADMAFWYDSEAGQWITSTYYMTDIPAWVKKFNTKSKVDSLYNLDWHLLYKEETYVQSLREGRGKGAQAFGSTPRKYPSGLKRYAGQNYGILPATPHGNTLTTEFAKASILGEQLGADSITDFLAVSYSSTDYLGHAYGPNSIEVEDAYLKLDLELGRFYDFLDKQVGEGGWMAFVTSDHGAAHVPAFAKEYKLPSGNLDEKKINDRLNEALKQQFGVEQLSKGIMNAQVILNIDLIKKVKKVGVSDVAEFSINWLEGQEGVSRAVRLKDIQISAFPEKLTTQIINGYYPERSGHIQILYKSGYIEGFMSGGTTHGTGYAYDTHIPLLWYGWGIPKGSSPRYMSITDIAPTLAALLGIQEPSGSSGKVITELFENQK
jgi:predicted AlkP superfamily pyrophosphatase or phosphodiesterase